MPHTFQEPRDDLAFLAIVDRVLGSLVRLDSPEKVFVVVIDNWFDYKWLPFSRYGGAVFPDGRSAGTASTRGDIPKNRITFPPFTPNRVVAQYQFGRLATGGYEEEPSAHRIHKRQYRGAFHNTPRRISDFCESGLFAWYSSGTANNQRGSLMVYGVRDTVVSSWFAGFSNRQGWKLDKVQHIGRKQVEQLMSCGSV